MNELRDKAVVVTGAGRGIGEGVAKAAAAAGASVVVNDIESDVAEAVAAEIRNRGGQALAVVADIRSWSAAEQLVERCVDAYGRIDGLVNNAGVFQMAAFDEIREQDVRDLLEVNVFGLIACAAPAARRMVEQGSGSIVNLCSGAQKGLPGMGVYGATKGAVASLTYSLSMELQARGVRCNAVSPVALTRMMEVMRRYMTAHGRPAPDFDLTPSRDAIAPVIVYLLSDASREVNGQIVRLEGDRLGLVTHPAVLLPLLEQPEWDFDRVRKAFEDDLSLREVPLGSHAVNAEFVTSGFMSRAAMRMLGGS